MVRCPYIHTDHLGIDEKLSWVDALWSRLLQHATWASVIHVWEFHHKQVVTLFELSKNPCITANDVTGTVYDLWLQMENRLNSSNEIAHIYVQFSIIRGTLTVSSIISRSTLTADLFRKAHYKETDQTTEI